MKTICREQVYLPKQDKPAIVVCDLRVHLFKLLASAQLANQLCNFDEAKFASWCLANWSLVLNSGLPWLRNQPAKGWYTIVVDDAKQDGAYWRQSLCESNGLANYKGNRIAQRGDDYGILHQSALAYLSQPNCEIPLFREPGFEADDFAGSIFRLAKHLPNGCETYLYTSDSDWMQLVDDDAEVQFANALYFKPRLRASSEVKQWAMRKGWLISQPSEIANCKQQFGDASDNLAPGSPIELFDLCNPPVKPDSSQLAKLWPNIAKSNANLNHAIQAKNWLIRNSLPICI